MNRLLQKTVVCILMLAFSLSALSCNRFGGVQQLETEESSTENFLEETDLSEESQIIETVYRIQYLDYEFISDDIKETWREPLEKLIANIKEPLVENKDILDYVAPDPDLPSIEPCFHLSLMDLNLDGIPELWANLGGGSSGNSFYYIYDIFTGEFLGSYGGAGAGSICAYLNTKTGKVEFFSKYQLRYGACARSRHLDRVSLMKNLYEDSLEIYSESRLSEYYSFDLLYEDDYGYFEKYSNASYYANGKECTWDDYYNAYDDFYCDYMRIPETALQRIYIYDYDDYKDDRFERAEKIVDALLSLEQEYLIIPTE